MKLMLAAMAASLLAGAQAAPVSVTDLAWMSGSWATVEGERWTEEVWVAPRGGVMLGLSRSGQGESLREYEYIRLQAGADGVPVYWASPGGGPPVGFRLAASDGTSATFENVMHDFPQRIQYRRDGDRLVATISAHDGSNPISWTYQRR